VLRDEMADGGPVRSELVEATRQQVLDAARRPFSAAC
jgi:flagellar motor switch protein FliG